MSERARKILVVDDEPDLEFLLLRRMRREVREGRYEFSFARDGYEALERLQEDREIEMVLSDINMPGMDGLTLLRQIPKIDPHIRAVIVSAYDDMQNIRTAMNRGAFDFVTKPLNFDDLKVTIEKTLGHLQLLREALETRDQLVVLQHELNIASQMQQSILPSVFPDTPGYDVFGHMEAARDVGGDFFEVIDLEGGSIGLVVADVSGKGVPAALFMMSSRTLIKASAIRLPDPSGVLDEANGFLEADNEASMFVTLVYAVLEPETGTLRYANGGHNPPLIVHPGGSSTFLPATGGVALGVVSAVSYRQRTVTLNPGDIAVLYTDGVTEAMNADDEEFGPERLQAVFAERQPQTAREVSQAIFDAVHAFAEGTPQSDDITCLIVVREFKDA